MYRLLLVVCCSLCVVYHMSFVGCRCKWFVAGCLLLVVGRGSSIRCDVLLVACRVLCVGCSVVAVLFVKLYLLFADRCVLCVVDCLSMFAVCVL